MKFLIYEIFSENKINSNEVYVLKESNFTAILIEKLPKSKEERIKKISEIRKNLKLKIIEISQNQFLNFIISSKKFCVNKISFDTEIEEEEEEEIQSFLKNKKYKSLLNKIKEDEYYYYIDSIEVLIGDLKIILKKNLEVEIIDNSYNKNSLYGIFDILEKENLLSDLVNQKDDLKWG